MNSNAVPSPANKGPSFLETFTPKLVTILREGYGLANLRADALAGLTVARSAAPQVPSSSWSPPRSRSMAWTA